MREGLRPRANLLPRRPVPSRAVPSVGDELVNVPFLRSMGRRATAVHIY